MGAREVANRVAASAAARHWGRERVKNWRRSAQRHTFREEARDRDRAEQMALGYVHRLARLCQAPRERLEGVAPPNGIQMRQGLQRLDFLG